MSFDFDGGDNGGGYTEMAETAQFNNGGYDQYSGGERVMQGDIGPGGVYGEQVMQGTPYGGPMDGGLGTMGMGYTGGLYPVGYYDPCLYYGGGYGMHGGFYDFALFPMYVDNRYYRDGAMVQMPQDGRPLGFMFEWNEKIKHYDFSSFREEVFRGIVTQEDIHMTRNSLGAIPDLHNLPTIPPGVFAFLPVLGALLMLLFFRLGFFGGLIVLILSCFTAAFIYVKVSELQKGWLVRRMDRMRPVLERLDRTLFKPKGFALSLNSDQMVLFLSCDYNEVFYERLRATYGGQYPQAQSVSNSQVFYNPSQFGKGAYRM